jgi:EAL and modified HD-GYP domain-containing signal transduction protein
MSRLAYPLDNPLTYAPASPREYVRETRSLLREPIFDLQERLHGYHLVPDAVEKCRYFQKALRTILDDLVLFGFDRLTGGLPAFVRCTEEMLTERLVAILPPGIVVLEIPQDMEITAKILDACRELREIGFRFALAGCTRPVRNPLLELADYVKVDFSNGDALDEELRRWLQGTTLGLMAEGIHTDREYRQALIGGFSCFQGLRLYGPELLRNAKPPANRQVHVDILHQLFHDPLDLQQVCPLVMRDPALVYRLLRLVDMSLHRQVESIESAILILGEATFRRMAILAIQCERDGGPPPEVVHRALVRARFCASAARLNKLNPDEQYLLGMASVFPAMSGLSVDAMALKLPLRPEIIEALLGVPVPERRLLGWIESQEQGAFSARYAPARIPDPNQSQLIRSYNEALAWETTRAAAMH